MTQGTGQGAGAGAGRLIVISGPSGSGKTSICKELVKDGRVRFSVSATTRPPRRGEVDGKDYRFLDPAEFQAEVDRDGFLEHVRYNGARYGTLKAPVDAAIARGETILLEIETQGTQRLRELRIPGLYIFIVPPDEGTLRSRLRSRSTETDAEVAGRLELAKGELEKQGMYDIVVVNDDLTKAVAEVRDAIARDGAKR
jgi:guanylate kinase